MSRWRIVVALLVVALASPLLYAEVANPGPVASAIVRAIQQTADPGLLGTVDSLGYRIAEIDRHIHGNERWFGKLGVQTATDWADNTISTPFRAISGNNTYGIDPGDASQVVGTADTPAIPGKAKYDLHRIFVSAASNSTTWKLRLIWGAGTMADAISGEQFTTVMFVPAIGASDRRTPIDVIMRRGTCGVTKVWMQAWNTTNDATIDFYVGWHEYEG